MVICKVVPAAHTQGLPCILAVVMAACLGAVPAKGAQNSKDATAATARVVVHGYDGPQVVAGLLTAMNLTRRTLTATIATQSVSGKVSAYRYDGHALTAETAPAGDKVFRGRFDR